MATLSVQRSGSGPVVLLVHGGMPASMTWTAQEQLAERWSLIMPSRRGFSPSPDATRQDFLVDADDLVDLVDDEAAGVHLVGYSCGGLGATLAATRVPDRIRSLTLIEVPLWVAAPDNESVCRLADLADRFAASADDSRAEDEFFELAGVSRKIFADGTDEVRQALELGRRLRSPREAQPQFDTIVEAGVPTLVVSGDHNRAMERLCDAVAGHLAARRAKVCGAGHAVPRARGFNAVLERFMAESGPR